MPAEKISNKRSSSCSRDECVKKRDALTALAKDFSLCVLYTGPLWHFLRALVVFSKTGRSFLKSLGKNSVDQELLLLKIFGTEVADVCNLLQDCESSCSPREDGVYKNLEAQYAKYLSEANCGEPKEVTHAKKYFREKIVKVESE